MQLHQQKGMISLSPPTICNSARNGLRYFHQLPYIDALKIKTEMITEIEDGFTVVLNGQYYWLPKTQ
ncbi:transposase IS26 [Acinetobacter baumannii TCDC-AB0715]|nr:transposase IS26 [Acinetobacter baumannii TCDC-AB0715]